MKRLLLILICAVIVIAAACYFITAQRNTEARALMRAEAYAEAINDEYKSPEKIYAFLCEDFRSQMSEDEFCQAFEKERSYPYITPLYLFKPELTMSDDKSSGEVIYLQAARIVGMTYKIELIYENGDYFVSDWSQFLDGSYLDKFKEIPYSLDWYYDFTEKTS
ncbi:MAG: hypothetical protein CVU91_01405 [Firmicutes bacterium HGW-Firmicutes-16]|nr:MAG: hypothetical protein CVU91_01405 [Firmicutes bacterium HGW-Firmicutes-16]